MPVNSQMSLLTLYTWPKSFADDHIAGIQRNAVRSWLQLDPKPHILVFGDEPGVREYCAAFGLTRVSDPMELIDGTVRIRDMAVKAEALSATQFYCFVNADIILTNSLIQALPVISSAFKRFFLGASPWNLNITEDLKYEPGWEEAIEKRSRAEGDLRPLACSDFFLYPQGYLASAPDLIIGRPYIDNGLMWYTRKRGDALIDATPGIFTVHQNHHYKHFGQKAERKGETAGALFNLEALGGRGRLYTWANATDHYMKDGLHPYWAGRICRWSTHAMQGSRASKVFNRLIWRTAAIASRPVRKVLRLVNPR